MPAAWWTAAHGQPPSVPGAGAEGGLGWRRGGRTAQSLGVKARATAGVALSPSTPNHLAMMRLNSNQENHARSARSTGAARMRVHRRSMRVLHSRESTKAVLVIPEAAACGWIATAARPPVVLFYLRAVSSRRTGHVLRDPIGLKAQDVDFHAGMLTYLLAVSTNRCERSGLLRRGRRNRPLCKVKPQSGQNICLARVSPESVLARV